MGFNGENNLDIDRLTMILEDNRGLLNDMTTKEANCSDGAMLATLLFELVEQAAIGGNAEGGIRSPTPTSIYITEGDEEFDQHRGAPVRIYSVDEIKEHNFKEEDTSPSRITALDIAATGHNNPNDKTVKAIPTAAPTTSCCRRHHCNSTGNRMKLPAANATTESPTMQIHDPEAMSKVATTQEIIGNLPKVWKVLIELLSHHKTERVEFEEHGASEDCYKSAETANGQKAELSVSKTYIKLKDLILEKKSLVKETNRLKTLNCHLEYRLNEQEKRLGAVSVELTKTWHLVGKMQRQHRQLHTQEQILRYQLQQKRRLLSELKDELEYCRRKWAAARAKNDESQEQCNDLRREFALRKLEHANNSAESGYSDSGQASDDEMAAAAAENVKSGIKTTAYDGSGGCVRRVGGAAAVCRRKRLREMFEHTRKVKRMQSTSPGRADNDTSEIVLRWNSAPPSCGWRDDGGCNDAAANFYDNEGGDNGANGYAGAAPGAADMVLITASNRGAIPKGGAVYNVHQSRREPLREVPTTGVIGSDNSRAERIHRLEEQCKSLMQRVLETSDNRQCLEVQLRSFEDEIAPVQYAVPLNICITNKRVDRMTRANSVPVTGTLTPREEEYTRKRSERLERLEEESRQLLSRIKRTSDRDYYLRCSLDRLRRAPSRESSFENKTEEKSSKTTEFVLKKSLRQIEQIEGKQSVIGSTYTVGELEGDAKPNPLTANEETYTAHRSARLERLENESRELLGRLSCNNERGHQLGNKLEALHDQMGKAEAACLTWQSENMSTASVPFVNIEKRLKNIEKISSNRMERLRILEEEGKDLLNRLAGTSARGSEMINRIAGREKHRQATSASISTDGSGDDDTNSAYGMDENSVASLLPALNTAAGSTIMSELTDRVMTTEIPSQTTAQGAIPKQTHVKSAGLILNAALRAKAVKNKETKQNPTSAGESLEDMVRRLREMPFPEKQNIVTKTETKEEEHAKDEEQRKLMIDEEQSKRDSRE
ncbi:PREDICTED: uncharacterized protein LOC108358589 [Rhagoletis zephyria]|uniref:uncharacterized protein LOC108358589 n=1 Tax=Rhagoletis zephyria TaxID=28612 RepID=UPI0008114874|nr:PREDICTED: uncharacterized protein LOC108358589 [Rhagoletis zephyria]